MGKYNLDSQLGHASFRCSCGESFKAAPDRVEDAPDRPWHPWAYFSQCPSCGIEARQAHWEINLFKGWLNATGPKSDEGKLASAANLDGHPTPEEARRTRFNAMKHGLFARVATHFPPRPGRYPHCDGCEHLENHGCVPFQACLKRVELYMRHDAAFQSQDPNLLTQLRSDTQSAIQAIISDMIFAIAQAGGPMITSPEWYYDKDGDLHFVEYTNDDGERVKLMKLEANPLLKPLIDFINKNNMTLSDMEMTPKVRQDQEILKGFLDDDKDREDAEAYRARLAKQNDFLLELVGNSYAPNGEKVIDAEVVKDG